MKQNDFKTTLRVFKRLQDESDTAIVAESIIRNFGGGRGQNRDHNRQRLNPKSIRQHGETRLERFKIKKNNQ